MPQTSVAICAGHRNIDAPWVQDLGRVEPHGWAGTLPRCTCFRGSLAQVYGQTWRGWALGVLEFLALQRGEGSVASDLYWHKGKE